jgi:hypothetical protein
MGRWGIAIAALLAFMVATADASSANRTCGRSHAKTEVSSRYGRVYGYTDPNDPDTSYVAGCLFRGPRPVVLSQFTFGAGGVSPVSGPYVLAGRFVAYADGLCLSGACGHNLIVTNLKRRRAVRSSSQMDGEPVKIVSTFSGLTGELARLPNSERHVVALDRSGARELDRGFAVRALSLHGHTLRWLHDGQPRSAELR